MNQVAYWPCFFVRYVDRGLRSVAGHPTIGNAGSAYRPGSKSTPAPIVTEMPQPARDRATTSAASTFPAICPTETEG